MPHTIKREIQWLNLAMNGNTARYHRVTMLTHFHPTNDGFGDFLSATFAIWPAIFHHPLLTLVIQMQLFDMQYRSNPSGCQRRGYRHTIQLHFIVRRKQQSLSGAWRLVRLQRSRKQLSLSRLNHEIAANGTRAKANWTLPFRLLGHIHQPILLSLCVDLHR